MLYAGLVILALSSGAVIQQAEPEALVRHMPFETLLYKTYPELTKPEPTVYFFQNLREVRAPRQAERWLREMEACLKSEDKEIIEYTPVSKTKFYEYSQGWGMKNHHAVELRGVWFVESIAYHDVLDATMVEQTIKHEMIHHLIGLTHHPLTPKIVGRCMPYLMLDERINKDAELTQPRRALSCGFGGIRGQRVGPEPLGRHGVLGGTGIFLGPQRGSRGTWILPTVRTPQAVH